MAGRVEQVQHPVAVRELDHGRGDGDAPAALQLHPVRSGRPALALGPDRACPGGQRPAVEQELLGERGLARVGVRDDRERAPPRRLTLGVGRRGRKVGAHPVSVARRAPSASPRGHAGPTGTVQIARPRAPPHVDRFVNVQAHFTPHLFEFLLELRANNDRAWFQDNKGRYEQHVKEPLLQFIADFGPKLQSISEHFEADTRTNGGSMFRIYRDVRFSKDKSPYKTQAAAQFRHEAGKTVHAPGFYLHLAPDEVFAGVGLWHPDSATLGRIRNRIVIAVPEEVGAQRPGPPDSSMSSTSRATLSSARPRASTPTIPASRTSNARTTSRRVHVRRGGGHCHRTSWTTSPTPAACRVALYGVHGPRSAYRTDRTRGRDPPIAVGHAVPHQADIRSSPTASSASCSPPGPEPSHVGRSPGPLAQAERLSPPSTGAPGW